MVEEQLVSLAIDLSATGITVGTSVGAQKARAILRRRKYSAELEDVATAFSNALRDAIEATDARSDTGELTGVVTDWGAVVTELAGLTGAADSTRTRRESEQVSVLFMDEEEAVREIADAIATAQGFDLTKTPDLRNELHDAVTEAYREAIAEFERQSAGTDLGHVFQQELQLNLTDQVGIIQRRLHTLEDDVELLLTQPARNDGFRQLSPAYFDRSRPTPETSWRTTFTLADVYADIPAARSGRSGDTTASDELLAIMQQGESRLVVGRAGAGKSTLCKQVAIQWYRDNTTGPVLYRDSDQATGHFESRDALREAIDRATGHVLVVIEDAIRAEARGVAPLVDEYEHVSDVSFLLDSRTEELNRDSDAETLDSGTERRHRRILNAVQPYPLPDIEEADIERVIESFEAATGRSVGRSPEALFDEVRTERAYGFGAFLLLSFHLPFGDYAVEPHREETGFEAHVRSRYKTLQEPGSSGALRDLSRFDPELLADVGVMVNLLNASGLGIHPGLVHSLGYQYGHDIETHDSIAEIRAALDGWFLYRTKDTADGPVRTTHELWSTLYLREIALDHREEKANGQRRERSEPRVSRCLESLFRLFDDEEHRQAVSQEFPESAVLAEIEYEPEKTAEKYLGSLMELAKRWPVLSVLIGTSRTARYDIPETCSSFARRRLHRHRAFAHLDCGEYSKAQRELQKSLEIARDEDNPGNEATSLGNLGVVAERRGDFQTAREYYHRSLHIKRDLDDPRGEAASFGNLGVVAQRQGEYETAREYHQRSHDIHQDLGDRHGEATSLGNLGMLAKNQGEYETAREYLQQALDIFRDLGDRLSEASTFTNLGSVAQNHGEYETAREYHQRALDIFRDMGARKGEATSLGNLGGVVFGQGEYDTAHEYLQRSHDIYQDLGDRHGEAHICCILGNYEHYRRRDERAKQHFETALSIADDIGAKPIIAKALAGIGEIQASDSNRRDEAKENLKRALDISNEVGNLEIKALVKNGQGRLSHEHENFDRARKHYLESYEIASEIGNHFIQTIVAGNLAIVCMDAGDHPEAVDWFEMVAEMSMTIGNATMALVSLSYVIELQVELGNHDAAREHGQHALELCEESDDALSRVSDLDCGWFENQLQRLAD